MEKYYKTVKETRYEEKGEENMNEKYEIETDMNRNEGEGKGEGGEEKEEAGRHRRTCEVGIGET